MGTAPLGTVPAGVVSAAPAVGNDWNGWVWSDAKFNGGMVSVAGVWKVFGYFIAGGILSGFGPALGEIIGNSFQMVVGLIVGFALFSAVRKAYPPLVRLGNLSVKAGE